MTIEILPARLANQIAAGEVVERPASVVKELVENSLDAGATAIKIDIEKGGAKRIRISDDGSGIVKEELTLALSRHATSKIKNLNDLEGIGSLGFRGEALASISSVARLTLTSKPLAQSNAWQACAEGRDMEVSVQPAAHPNGTTIDVVDLFFNTPARRKFLHTEKTEFSHIEEVIKRIALAHFSVSFVLTHNGKIVRQYRSATNDNQKTKRVAQVCGQGFIDHALMVNCEHDGLTLTGWIAKPSFGRKQNDLCYSYVNGRMMRDKLINHAIRQSYQELLPTDTYPAFVLFLSLNVRDVDVNVHPAKHEVRFHQARYVHDFIVSVCHQALLQTEVCDQASTGSDTEQHISNVDYHQQLNHNAHYAAHEQVNDYIAPLRSNEASNASSGHQVGVNVNYLQVDKGNRQNSATAHRAYQTLMTPLSDNESHHHTHDNSIEHQLVAPKSLQFFAPEYAVYNNNQQLRLLSLVKIEQQLQLMTIEDQWEQGLTSQPLLLPIKLVMPADELALVQQHQITLAKLGIIVNQLDKTSLQIRQFPAILRERDVTKSFNQLIRNVKILNFEKKDVTQECWQKALVDVLTSDTGQAKTYTAEDVTILYNKLQQLAGDTINQVLTLNSTAVDLTSAIEELK